MLHFKQFPSDVQFLFLKTHPSPQNTNPPCPRFSHKPKWSRSVPSPSVAKAPQLSFRVPRPPQAAGCARPGPAAGRGRALIGTGTILTNSSALAQDWHSPRSCGKPSRASLCPERYPPAVQAPVAEAAGSSARPALLRGPSAPARRLPVPAPPRSAPACSAPATAPRRRPRRRPAAGAWCSLAPRRGSRPAAAPLPPSPARRLLRRGEALSPGCALAPGAQDAAGAPFPRGSAAASAQRPPLPAAPAPSAAALPRHRHRRSPAAAVRAPSARQRRQAAARMALPAAPLAAERRRLRACTGGGAAGPRLPRGRGCRAPPRRRAEPPASGGDGESRRGSPQSPLGRGKCWEM